MNRFYYLCLALAIMAAPVHSLASTPYSPDEALPKGEVITRVKCLENQAMSYALYLPSNFTPNRKWPLLLLFDPAARGAFPMKFFTKAAEHYGFIVACTYDTANYTPWEKNSKGIEAMWNDLLQRFPVDGNRMYAGGMSGGARLASRVALTTGQIQGLIACGAGFWQQTAHILPPEFEVVSTVGTEDFNFLELVDLEADLKTLKIPSRRVVFHGPHWWPDEDVALEAFDYLQVQAYKKGLIGLAEVRAADQVKHRVAQAELLAEAGDLYHAALKYRDLIHDLGELTVLDKEKARWEALTSSKEHKTQAKDQKKAERREDTWRKEFLGRLKHGEDLAAKDPIAIRREVNWWRKEVGVLTKRMNEAKSKRERSAATRIFSLVWANIYERSVYFLREGDLDKAIFANGLAEMMKPNAFAAPYNLACAHALAGDKEKAFEALDRCVANGYPGAASKISGEPMLDSLKSDPRFQAALDRLPSPK